MSRINLVDPSLLTQKALIAEYRELPRIFNLVRKAVERGERPHYRRNPNKYVLGTGHVRFLYPRLRWLVCRQRRLVDECVRRGIQIQYTDPESLGEGIPAEWWGDYNPTIEAIKLNAKRIDERGGFR